MKIFFIGQKGIPCLAYGGGVERHLENLVKILKRKYNHKIYVYARRYYSRKSSIKGVKLLFIPTIRIKWLETPLYCLLASINVLFQKPDIIHYQGMGPSLFIWIPKLFSNSKVIATIHCRDYFHKKWGKLAQFAFRLGEYFACKFADEVIVVSEELKEYIKDQYNRDSILINHGIINSRKAIKSDLLKKFNLRPKKYILYVGRFIKHKKIDYLIESYKKLPLNIKRDYTLAIAGGSSYTDSYKNCLIDLSKGENIRFLGWVNGEALDVLYKNALCLVYPSEYEGSSLTLIEAAAKGVIIIANKIRANREILNKYAYYFNGDFSNNDLVNVLKRIITSKSANLKLKTKNLKKIISKKYSLNKLGSLTNSVYR